MTPLFVLVHRDKLGLSEILALSRPMRYWKRGTMIKLSKIIAVLAVFFLWVQVPLLGGQYDRRWPSSSRYPQICAYAQEGPEQKDGPNLEWFRKELRVAPKYQERDTGILGLSWAHFSVMVFLTVSFVIALVALIVRYRRTKELISMLTKDEMTDGKKG